MPTLYRLNRAIALTGIASRRKADELIAAGKVMVNGVLTTDFSLLVDIDQDQIVVDGEEVVTRFHDYLLLNKPKDYVSTCDDERGRRTVLDLLPPELRHLKPVGRLDRDSEGLILLTNDGELAKLLTHPSHDVAKIYEVTVKGQMQAADYSALAKGIRLSDGVTRPAKVRKISANSHATTFEMQLYEGRNRQIRRMCAALGYDVNRLVRVAIGGLQLRQLPPGKWRRLTDSEISTLYRS